MRALAPSLFVLSLLVLACDGGDAGDETLITAPAQTTWATSAGSMSMSCEGEGTVPVVLLAGGADPAETWDEVVSALGPEVLTCRFDRPGVGGSDALSGPTTPGQVADVLAEVLETAELDADTLIVGHSLGGLTARLYGAAHADSMRGAVLLDPTVPDPEDTILIAELEMFGWDADATITEGQAVDTWPVDIPLTVLSHDAQLAIDTGTWTAEDQMRWSEGQEAYGGLTPSGTQREVPGATHYVYRSHPEEAVEAIEALLP